MLKKHIVMRNTQYIKFILIIMVLLCGSVFAAGGLPSEPTGASPQTNTLFSPSVSKKFYEIAYDLAYSDNAEYFANEQAMAFLIAAMNLDKDNSEVRSLLLKCTCRFSQQRAAQMGTDGLNNSDLVYTLLRQYVDEKADISLAVNAALFLLNQADSTAIKQTLLEQMIGYFENKNPVFCSELEVMLGLLKVQNKTPEEAVKYFYRAYQANKYNKFAFSKLVDLAPKLVSPQEHLERLRLDFRENPADIRAVLALCKNLEQMLLYDEAASGYEYCSHLFEYLYPLELLPADIYIPWSISCYNSRSQRSKCLEIAETIRKTGKLDIMLESLAGRASVKLGEAQTASQILKDAEKKAIELFNNKSQTINETQMAWFYNFVIPMPDRAIEWSNKAFSKEPNSPVASSLLAYSLTEKKEYGTAKNLINTFERTQISDLALAKIQLDEGQTEEGMENLKRAISRDPGSFEAEFAKELLGQNGEKYESSVDPASLRPFLVKTFGSKFIPDFIPPEKMFSVNFNIRNEELMFGSDLDCVLSITNNTKEPLLIDNNSMFRGNIRIDAIVSGDLSRKISSLVTKRVWTAEVIEPGKSKVANLRLLSGELRNMLAAFPQASLDLSFILYIDPVESGENKTSNRLTHISPVPVSVTRPGIKLSSQQLKNLVESVSTGTSGQKIQYAQLFIGLLKEQNALSGRTPPYNAVFIDGMGTLLKSALINDSGLLKNPENGDLAVKVYTMAEMFFFPLDYELIETVSENMYNDNWPVRMTAVYLLAESQGQKFLKVLEVISKSDKNLWVRNIAEIETRKIRSQEGKL
jgi:hypothetical protein